MAQTAINQLQEQVEAIRREAYAAGYAAAMQVVRDLAARPAPGAEAAAPPVRRGRRPAQAAAPAPQPGRRAARGTAAPTTRPRRVMAQRPQRGTNARLVEEVLQSNAPRALRPAEIRTTIQRDKGVAIAFTSIRHALGQLEARQVAEPADGNKTWRYRGGASSLG